MRVRLLTLAALVAGFGAFSSLAAAADDPGAQENTREIPWPTKSWQTSSPEEQGMDSARLAKLIETVGTYKQDSLTIIRHGKIVADAYLCSVCRRRQSRFAIRDQKHRQHADRDRAAKGRAR